MSLKIDWYYHRPGCVSCKRAQSYLANAGAEIVEEVNSRKVKYGPDEAVAMARQARRLFVAKGKTVRRVDLNRDTPTDAELIALIVGPTGTLRAPAIRRGADLFVGYHLEEYQTQLTG